MLSNPPLPLSPPPLPPPPPLLLVLTYSALFLVVCPSSAPRRSTRSQWMRFAEGSLHPNVSMLQCLGASLEGEHLEGIAATILRSGKYFLSQIIGLLECLET